MPRRWMTPVALAGLAVFVGGLAIGLVSSRADEPDSAAPSTTAAPTPTTPATTAASTTTARAAPTTAAAPPEAHGPGDTRVHVGRFFTVEVPADWEAVVVDEDPGYSVPATRTTFEGDGSFLTVETQTPLTGTIEDSCQSIFEGLDDAEVRHEPTTKRVHDVETCEFEWQRSDGESRIDILFAHGDRGFAVLAGSTDDFHRAKDAARHAVETLVRTDG